MRFTSQTSRHHLETLSQLGPDPVDPYKSAVQCWVRAAACVEAACKQVPRSGSGMVVALRGRA